MEQVLKNFYTKDEIDRIWKEIQFLDSNDYGWKYPNKFYNATDKNNKLLLKETKQLGLSLMYGNYDNGNYPKSNIYTLGKKLLNWTEALSEKHNVYSNVKNVTYHGCSLNSFGDNSEYKLHHDASMYTMLSYFYEEPKNFTGGKFIVEDREYEISNGFTIILPGWLKHGVTPVKIIDKSRKKSGRYSVAHFFGIGERKQFPILSDYYANLTYDNRIEKYEFFKFEKRELQE